jgi:hypothetical protein
MSQPQYFYDSKIQGSFVSTGWVWYPFGFMTRSQVIISPYNTNTDDILYSWDGQTTAGRVGISSYALNLQEMRRTGIWIKANSATQDALLIGY